MIQEVQLIALEIESSEPNFNNDHFTAERF